MTIEAQVQNAISSFVAKGLTPRCILMSAHAFAHADSAVSSQGCEKYIFGIRVVRTNDMRCDAADFEVL